MKETDNTPLVEIDRLIKPATSTMIDRYIIANHWTKGKKVIDKFDEMKNIASNRLEDWLEEDEDINQNLDFKQKSFYNNERTSIQFSEKKEDDPWI